MRRGCPPPARARQGRAHLGRSVQKQIRRGLAVRHHDRAVDARIEKLRRTCEREREPAPLRLKGGGGADRQVRAARRRRHARDGAAPPRSADAAAVRAPCSDAGR
jgi:hypothetical protein